MRIDAVDEQILKALEIDARISFTTLASRIGVKVNKIYYRLRKLQERGILRDFTISIDPSAIGLEQHLIFRIYLRTMEIEALNEVFIENFASYMGKQHREFSFISICENNIITAIGSFWDEEHFRDVFQTLLTNINVVKIEVSHMNKVIRGVKLFHFLPKPTLER